MPILVNLSITNDITESIAKEIIEGCRSLKHKVYLNIYDFSLNKIAKKYTEENQNENLKISVQERDYEESNEYVKIAIQDIIKYADCQSACFLNDSVSLLPQSIDRVNFDIFKDENCGFIYFDYTIGNIRCFLRSSGNNGAVPFIFFSMKKIIENLSKEEPIQDIFSNTISLHIPESLGKVYPNDDKS